VKPRAGHPAMPEAVRWTCDGFRLRAGRRGIPTRRRQAHPTRRPADGAQRPHL